MTNGSMGRMCNVHKLAWALILVGALNWGLVGIFQIDLLARLVGTWPMLLRVLYALVGFSAIAMLLKGNCKGCKMESK